MGKIQKILHEIEIMLKKHITEDTELMNLYTEELEEQTEKLICPVCEIEHKAHSYSISLWYLSVETYRDCPLKDALFVTEEQAIGALRNLIAGYRNI